MNRYRWFRADWPISMRALGRRLKAKQFADEVVDGFVVDRVRDDYVEARYIERIELEDVVTDPFGNEHAYERVEFRQAIFRATSGVIGLELQDPPRSTHGLVSRLAEANDFSLAIAPIAVDVVEWAMAFQRASSVDVLVDAMQIGGLEVEPGVSAKVVLRGVRDVREAGRTFAAKRRHIVERIQLKLSGSYRGKVSLASLGAATVSSDRADAIAGVLRQTLAEVIGAGTSGRA